MYLAWLKTRHPGQTEHMLFILQRRWPNHVRTTLSNSVTTHRHSRQQ